MIDLCIVRSKLKFLYLDGLRTPIKHTYLYDLYEYPRVLRYLSLFQHFWVSPVSATELKRPA